MLELILTGLVVLGIIKFVQIAILGIQTIYGWFQQQQTEGKVDAKAVGFTIREALDKGSYRLVQGVFNTLTNEVTAARGIAGEQVDSSLATLHDGNDVVIYG